MDIDFDKVPDRHMPLWNPRIHYCNVGGQCGQSCPCCRAAMNEILGSCLICLKIKKKKEEKKK